MQLYNLSSTITSDEAKFCYVRIRYQAYISLMTSRGILPTKDEANDFIWKAARLEGILLPVNIEDHLEVEWTFHEAADFKVTGNDIRNRNLKDYPGVITPDFNAEISRNTIKRISEAVDELSGGADDGKSNDELRSRMPEFKEHVEERATLDVADLSAKLHEFCARNIDDLMRFVGLALYQGFNRGIVTQEVFRMLGHQSIFVLSTIVALRGPAKCYSDDRIGMIDLSMADGSVRKINALTSDGSIKPEKSRAGGKLKPTDVTMGRVNACFPDLAAYGLLQLERSLMIGKRIGTNDLPAFLQFPQAASLPMTEKGRRLHIEFSMAFSKLIKGTFALSIHSQQSTNVVPISGMIANELISASEGCLCQFADNVPNVEVAESKEEGAKSPSAGSTRKGEGAGSKDAK